MRKMFTIVPAVLSRLPLHQAIDKRSFSRSIKLCLPRLLHSRSFDEYYNPWKSLFERENDSTVTAFKDKFQVCVNVQQFAPEEISVKVQDGVLVIQGKHEEKKDDYGFVSRQFLRRYMLPAGHEGKDVVSSLSADGILTVTAPKNTDDSPTSERVVPIAKTEAPHNLPDKSSKMKKIQGESSKVE